MAKKIRGGKFTTQKEYENVIDRDKKVNRILTNVVIVNLDKRIQGNGLLFLK